MKRIMDRKLVLTAVIISLVASLSVACAPRQATEGLRESGATEPVDASQAAWTPESDCLSCHTSELESGNDPACTYSIHVAQGASCMHCHTDADGKLEEAHADYAVNKVPTKLRYTDVEEEACLSCHDKEGIKAATVDSVVLTDENGTAVNPHDLPVVGDHDKNNPCSSCHQMHKPTSLEEDAKQACSSCHHMNVFECGTCHE